MPIRHAVILAVLCTIPGGSVAAQPVQSTCDLDKILEAVPKSSASTRTRLLVAALNETCADELDGGLQVWLTTWRGGTVNEADATLVEARRDQACPKGVDLWGAALNTDLPQTLSDFAKTCKLRKLGLTDHADGTAGPEAALLGSSVYQSLVDHGADADKARTIGAWISGARYPGEPRFSRGVYGEVAGHIQGVTLPVLAGHPQMQQRSCEPVIAIHPGQTQLNGVEVSSEELSAGLSDCATEMGDRFREQVVFAADDNATYGEVYGALSTAKSAKYYRFQLVGLGGDNDVFETSPMNAIATYLGVVAPSRPPKPAPKGVAEPDAKSSKASVASGKPSSSKGGKASVAGVSRANRAGQKLAMIGAGGLPAPTVSVHLTLLEGSGVQLTLDGEVVKTVPLNQLGDLSSELTQVRLDNPDLERFTVQASESAKWSDAVAVILAATGTEDQPIVAEPNLTAPSAETPPGPT